MKNVIMVLLFKVTLFSSLAGGCGAWTGYSMGRVSVLDTEYLNLIAAIIAFGLSCATTAYYSRKIYQIVMSGR